MRSNSSGSLGSSGEQSNEETASDGCIVAAVATQGGHVTYLVTTTGLLFAVGNKQNPAVFVKPLPDKELKPSLLPLPVAGARVVGVAAGHDHALAWDEDGNLYGWGVNRSGCLGLRDNHLRNEHTTKTMEVVESARGAKVVACFIVEHASFCVTFQGKVFHWGK